MSEENRPPTFYLIDSYAAIFRAYYAIRRPLYSPVTGEETQGILVFAQMLHKLYTVYQPEYVALAWDAPGATFRDSLHALYASNGQPLPVPADTEETGEPGEPGEPTISEPGYKGTRRATPDSLHRQIKRIREFLTLTQIPVVACPGLEADDVIATIADRVLADPAHSDLHIRIVTHDKDMEQLLHDRRVTLFSLQTGAETDADTLHTKRGITPSQVVDYLSLTGDTVDNVPGVEGIGAKTAAKLLQQYGSLEGILAHLDALPERWRRGLEKAAPTLPVSRQMIALKHDAPIPFTLDDARVRRPLPVADLLPFFEEMGFHRLQELYREMG